MTLEEVGAYWKSAAQMFSDTWMQSHKYLMVTPPNSTARSIDLPALPPLSEWEFIEWRFDGARQEFYEERATRILEEYNEVFFFHAAPSIYFFAR